MLRNKITDIITYIYYVIGKRCTKLHRAHNGDKVQRNPI